MMIPMRGISNTQIRLLLSSSDNTSRIIYRHWSYVVRYSHYVFMI